MSRNLDHLTLPAIVEQQKLSTFICSACGAGRDCDCDAPAWDRLAAVKELARQRKIKQRARERENGEQNQQPRHVTEPADDPPYWPQAREKTPKPEPLPRSPKMARDFLKEAADHKTAILDLLPQMRRIEREQFEEALLEEVEQLNARLEKEADKDEDHQTATR